METVLTVRRLPAARHSFSSYFVVINEKEKAELPPIEGPYEVRIVLEPGKHVLRITGKPLGIETSLSKELEVIADGKPIIVEATAFIRGLLFWAEPIIALLPWLWFRDEVVLNKVAN